MLDSIKKIKHYWKTNSIPIYFVSPTLFNLFGMDRWVGAFKYIGYIDTFDDTHPNVMIPKRSGTPVFNHLEDINRYLLDHPQVIDELKSDAYLLFLFFDREIEAMCQSLSVEIALPAYDLLNQLDSKIVTTELGNEAGVESVPNVLTKISSYSELCRVAKRHRLGTDWVIQTPYGDSGKTTYFIASEADYEAVSEYIQSEDKVKIMKRIRAISTAIEACATREGTFVGPLMGEIIGMDSLTPFRGGWCGNTLFQADFSPDIRQQAMGLTQKLGDQLYARGYRGYFEVDYLIDADTGRVYLGELNPRLSGVSAMTNLSPFCQETLPLFLFHLLEFFNVDFSLDATAYNQTVLREGAKGVSGQLILKYTPQSLAVIQSAPCSGVYTVNAAGVLILKKKSSNRLEAVLPDEVFVFRIMEASEYAYFGADLAIIFVNFELTSPEKELTPQAQACIRSVREAFVMRPLTLEEEAILERYTQPSMTVK